MKYFIALFVFFSAPAYAEVFNSLHWQWAQPNRTHNVTQTNKQHKQHKQRVTLYSTNHCPYCKQARDYFRANNIPYLERNIERSSDALRRFKAMKAFGTPTIVLGKRKMIGFDIPRFQRFYR